MTERSNLKTDLDVREGLPDALRVLLAEYPREAWEGHPGFDGLVRFWLERHMMFRRMLDVMSREAKQRLDDTIDPQTYRANLSRLGSMFVGQLHGHHTIEDTQYFPILAAKDRSVARGFDILDADHHALDGMLNRYVEAANAALNAPDVSRSEIARFHDETEALERLLSRHLVDEEDLIVPVILKHGTSGLG